jgi:hypothetical protein
MTNPLATALTLLPILPAAVIGLAAFLLMTASRTNSAGLKALLVTLLTYALTLAI